MQSNPLKLHIPLPYLILLCYILLPVPEFLSPPSVEGFVTVTPKAHHYSTVRFCLGSSSKISMVSKRNPVCSKSTLPVYIRVD